jgi:hypothetical protein
MNNKIFSSLPGGVVSRAAPFIFQIKVKKAHKISQISVLATY